MKLLKVAFIYNKDEIVGYIKPELLDSFLLSTSPDRKMAHCQIAVNRSTDTIIKNPCIKTEDLIEFLVTGKIQFFKL